VGAKITNFIHETTYYKEGRPEIFMAEKLPEKS
jgi:hypothetical protein